MVKLHIKTDKSEYYIKIQNKNYIPEKPRDFMM